TVVIILGGQDLPRVIDNTTLASLNRETITLSGNAALGEFEVYALNWNGDNKADVFVGTPAKGLLFSGATIMATASLVDTDRLFELNQEVVNKFAVTGILAGDINGDGLDDLLFHDKEPGAGNRVYFLAGRPDSALTASSLTLGTAAG